MNKKNLNIILIILVLILGGVLIYQNFISSDSDSSSTAEVTEGEQLWTCGMHPDIISEEPGNCPICGMKLTPVKNSNTNQSGEREILYWVAPMDPNEIYNEPGKSKMGMDLVPVYADEASQAGVVTIDPTVQQNMNVKFSTVEKRSLDPTIETNATFEVDERSEYQINARVSGWIETLLINYQGQSVRKGEKLLEIYSPELVSAQQEYLTALKYKKKVENSSLSSSGDELINNAYRKLTLLNMEPKEIFALENENEVKTTIPLYSPVAGTVLMKNVVEGEKISAGQNLLHIANLSNLWLKADIYESDISHVNVGDKVIITVDAFPGETFSGKITFIDPIIQPKSRTTQVRIDVPNPDKKLKPSMLAQVEIQTGKTIALPVIPETAVIRSGEKNIAVQYLGEGKFKPVNLVLGDYANDYYQVLSGLNTGDKVVTSAQFLIDSESSLKTAMKNFGESQSNEMNMESDSSTMNMQSEEGDSDIIRKGVIDLNAIDKNNDGKVYQDMMDWNVISDEPGKCPICEMTLSEVTLEQARKNLVENGFDVKGSASKEQKVKSENEHSKTENEGQSELVRTGVIDLEAIDKNGDGKLFECPMDWNVLADEYQRCPLCEMKMKEYSIDEVKANLERYGYDHK